MKYFLLIFGFMLFFNSPTHANEFSKSDIMFEKATKAVKTGRYLEALDIFELLAENNEADAQYNLALLLKSGKGKPQNFQASLKWGWLALLGKIEAADKLVDEIKEIVPEPVLRSIRKEVKNFVKTKAEAGDRLAISQMGDYFLLIPENPEYKDAYLWFLIASAFQIDDGIARRDKTQKELEGKDIVSIQSKALEIFNNISQNMK